jgi:flagellar biosynthesis protein FlhG
MKSQVEALKEYLSLKLRPFTHVIAVISGKGGVGKTNLVANLGLSLFKFGFKVLLVDFDLGMSNLDVILGLSSGRRFNLLHYIEGKATVEQIISKSELGVDIIAGALGEESVVNINTQQAQQLIAQLELVLGNYNFVILDMGAGVAENTIKLALSADNIILLTTPEPHALLSAYGTLKILKEKITTHSLYLVINFVKNKVEGERVQKGFIETVYKFLNLSIEPLGYMLYDPVVSASVREKKPFVITSPQALISGNIEAISFKMCTYLGLKLPTKRQSFLYRLFQNFF